MAFAADTPAAHFWRAPAALAALAVLGILSLLASRSKFVIPSSSKPDGLSPQVETTVQLARTQKMFAGDYPKDGVYNWNSKFQNGAESTIFRFKSKMYVMESVEGYLSTESAKQKHGEELIDLAAPWPEQAGASYFRIVDLESGKVLHSVQESIGHAYFSATVDNKRGRVWVFGAAHDRADSSEDHASCDLVMHNRASKGCYVGVWHSDDLENWSDVKRLVRMPAKEYTMNVAVTLVDPDYSNWEAVHGTTLPRHQAIMVLEGHLLGGKPGVDVGAGSSFAINTGTDGDLSRDSEWHILAHDRASPAGNCPAIHYDSHHGYYYLTGGGETQYGPFRSLDLQTWEMSRRGPITENAVTLAHHGRHALAKAEAHISASYYKARWASLSNEELMEAQKLLSQQSGWGFGNSDFDWCCDDGKQPSYFQYMISEQGLPEHQGRKKMSFQVISKIKKPLVKWLESYFPSALHNKLVNVTRGTYAEHSRYGG